MQSELIVADAIQLGLRRICFRLPPLLHLAEPHSIMLCTVLQNTPAVSACTFTVQQRHAQRPFLPVQPLNCSCGRTSANDVSTGCRVRTCSAFVQRLGVASLAAYTQRLGSLMADRCSFAPQLSCTCAAENESRFMDRVSKAGSWIGCSHRTPAAPAAGLSHNT